MMPDFVQPLFLEFDVEQLSEMLTIYGFYREEFDDRFFINVNEINFQAQDGKFFAKCSLFKHKEH